MLSMTLAVFLLVGAQYERANNFALAVDSANLNEQFPEAQFESVYWWQIREMISVRLSWEDRVYYFQQVWGE